jgi:two-component system CheB/CheR fusion protein
MALLNGYLQLLNPTEPHGLRLPINFFFRSLAQDQRERAICIVLAGTGSDGTLGARAVKGEGGMVMAQEPESTEYSGMPHSAIATGLVDYVLPPAKMAEQLMAYAAHAFGKKSGSPKASATVENVINKICILLRAHTGHDFSQYKTTTLRRRIERRIALHLLERPDEYLSYLQRNSTEVEALFRDLLIGVTSFFRDPDAFASVESNVIPRLFADKTAGETVRVWVCGCATGEEAYSLAILIQEHLETLKQAFVVQLFATDIDQQAIDQARTGVFPASISGDVTPERLARFFSLDKESGNYRIRKDIRDMLVFSEQDLIKDPPFSRLDLISCRNLLIYLNGTLQKKLIPLFHYALSPGGTLFLGNSETVGDFLTLFTVVDRKWKIYQREEANRDKESPSLGDFVPPYTEAGARPQPASRGRELDDLRKLTQQNLLEHYAQAGILVNGRGDILHIYGRTGEFLEPAPGDASGMNALAMARTGLRQELTAALRKTVANKEIVKFQRLRVKTNGNFVSVNLTVRPVMVHPSGNTLPDVFLIILETLPEAGEAQTEPKAAPAAGKTNDRVTVLEQQLHAKEEYLQTTIEEMETTNEELKSTNEELQSVNEELQSTNEEMETSKEELQSVNEELSTVNTELQSKVNELSRVNNDMNNLLAGTGVGTLFVDMRLCIARFTPATTKVINLIQTDIGRPVGHIVNNLVGYDSLVKDIKNVLDTLVPLETEVQIQTGTWYLMHVRPYRTLENVIEGAVITFVDITERKKIEATLRETEQREAALREGRSRLASDIVNTVRHPLLVLDKSFRVVVANRTFYRKFGAVPEKTTGELLFLLGNGQWNIPELRSMLEEILSRDTEIEDYEVTHEFTEIGRLTMLLNARRMVGEDSGVDMILVAIEDITEPESDAG